MRRAWVLLVFLIVGGVGAAAYTLRVDQVKVTGLDTLDAADVVRASGIEPGQRILWIRLSAATRNVEKIAAVEHAVAVRSLPGTVVIRITERRPVAKLDRRPDLVADATGRLFPGAKSARLPVLSGWRANRSARSLDTETRAALRAFARFPGALRKPTRRIAVRPGLTLVLDHGLQIRFGRLSDLEAKALAALAVLRAERGKPVAYVDVRVPTVPVVGAVATPTPAPTASSNGPAAGPATGPVIPVPTAAPVATR